MARKSKAYQWVVNTNVWLANCVAGKEYDFFEHGDIEILQWLSTSLEIGGAPKNGTKAIYAKELPHIIQIGGSANKECYIMELPKLSNLDNLVCVGNLGTFSINRCGTPLIPKIMGFDQYSVEKYMIFGSAEVKDFTLDFANVPKINKELTIHPQDHLDDFLKCKVKNLHHFIETRGPNSKFAIFIKAIRDSDLINPEHNDFNALLLLDELMVKHRDIVGTTASHLMKIVKTLAPLIHKKELGFDFTPEHLMHLIKMIKS